MIVKDPAALTSCRARKRCEHCGATNRVFHAAHIRAVAGCRIDWRGNLVCLCALCHTEHHNGKDPTRTAMVGLAAVREGVLAFTLIEAVNAIWLAPKGSDLETILQPFGLKP